MTEPLYRIWDIEEQTFIPQDNYKWYVGMEGFVRNRDGFVSQAHFIIQRCTGETDVNGKYIYEGDITKQIRDRRYWNDDIITVIEFNYGTFTMKTLYRDDGFDSSLKLEIIGNNLENPELLLERDEDE